jgi:outer membrane protein OmpA-like peptidoglycan-associated protein
MKNNTEETMNVKTLLFLFFISATLLIYMALDNVQELHKAYLEQVRLSKIQTLCLKPYPRTRKEYVPQRSIFLAKREIEKKISDELIDFQERELPSSVKSKLIKIVNILNHLKEDVALSIEVHTDINGSKQENLQKSQEKADVLKQYFSQKIKLPLVVAVGYGDMLSSSSTKNKKIVLDLKRIKP